MGFKIGNHEIGLGHPPFIIAEMSGNHNQSLDRALKIVELAAESGAHAVKLQTYKPSTMTLDHDSDDFIIQDASSLWNGKKLYQLYQEAMTPWQWHEAIFKKCKDLGLVCFSSPFDHEAVDLLESLQVPCYKIASFENKDMALLKRVAATGKPVIMSTGATTLAEIDESMSVLRAHGCTDICLLKCTSTYPAEPLDSNVKTIPHMRDLFKCEVGLSDHTMGLGVAVASVALGATLIEKHFTTSRSEGGVDSAFSMEPQELKALVIETKRAWQGLGSIKYGVSKSEQNALKFKRSIYATQSIKAGELFDAKNIQVIRPGFGLAPKFLDIVIGKHANKDISRGTAISWDHIG